MGRIFGEIMKEGYFQTKLKEQGMEIDELKMKIKEMENKITFSKKGYDDAKELMSKAIDLERFKNTILNCIKEDFHKRMKEQYQFFHENNQKSVDCAIEEISKLSSKYIREQLTHTTNIVWSTLNILIEKKVLTSNDVKKIGKLEKYKK